MTRQSLSCKENKYNLLATGFRKTRFLKKKPNPLVFGFYWVLGFIGFSDSNEYGSWEAC